MMYRTFVRAIPGDDSVEDDLNRFVATHRILDVKTQWTTRRSGADETPYLVYLVAFLPGRGNDGAGVVAGGAANSRVDYAALLSPSDFSLYNTLRDWRKAQSEKESVKAFVICTNAQLAEIAKSRPKTIADLRKVEGFGEARADKYGEALLHVVAKVGVGADEAADARIIDSIRGQSTAAEETDSKRPQSIAVDESLGELPL